MLIASCQRMRYYREITAIMFMTMMCHVNLSYSSLTEEEHSLLKIRTGKHSGFIRIVLEGPEKLISEGRIEKKGNDLHITFAELPFSIEEKKLPLRYRIDEKRIVLLSDRTRKVRTFTMTNPSRMVIDVYRIKNKSEYRNRRNYGDNAKKEKNDGAHDGNKRTTSGTSEKTGREKAKVTTARDRSAVNDRPPSPSLKKQKNITPPLVNMGKEAYADDSNETYGFITKDYRKIWKHLQSGNAYRVIKELDRIHPENEQAIAVHHFIYGMAYNAIEDYLAAIKHFRLSYIFTTDASLKELAYLKRAEAYLQQKLYYEAKINYTVFLEKYPSSRFKQKVHNDLAKTLSLIGFYREAAEHFKKAGVSPEVLYSYANSLQRTHRFNEAKKAYARAILSDKTYPARSPETYFLIGENMRMTGDRENAKKHLMSIEKGPFQFEAKLSLGVIALEENNTDDAVTHLIEASISSDRKIRIKALFHLATAYSLKNKNREAITTLEIIRKKYLNSSLYKRTLLELAKLYKKEGSAKESISLLKELVYGKLPPEEAFSELEKILVEAGKKYSSGEDEKSEFLELWNEVGLWMFDESREDFLLGIAEQLRDQGMPYLQLCTWLVNNGSAKAKVVSALNIADYSIKTGDINKAHKYLDIARANSLERGDFFLRVEAKLHHKTQKYRSAMISLQKIKKSTESDLLLLGKIIADSGELHALYIDNALDYYESMLAGIDGPAEIYITLADIMLNRGNSDRALKYYRMALKKNPDDEWTIYRIGRIVSGPESFDMFSRMSQNDTLLSRAARTKVIELSLIKRVEEVY